MPGNTEALHISATNLFFLILLFVNEIAKIRICSKGFAFFLKRNTKIRIDVCTKNTNQSDIIEVKIFAGKDLVNSAKSIAGQSLEINIPDAKLWSTDFERLLNCGIYANYQC